MGRTTPTATEFWHREIETWKPFRSALSKSERKQFDNMLDLVHLNNMAMTAAAPQHPIPFQLITMSIIFQHYRQLKEMENNI